MLLLRLFGLVSALAVYLTLPARPAHPRCPTAAAAAATAPAGRDTAPPFSVRREGGVLALEVAAAAPGEVGPVVSVDGVPFLPALQAGDAVTPEEMRPRAEAAREMYASLTPAQLEAQTRAALPALMRDPGAREEAARWAAASDPATVGQAFAEMMTTDLRPRLAAIRAPVLLLGSGDGAPPAQIARMRARYEAQVAGIEHHTVLMAPDARHFIMLDDPDLFFRALDAFLAGR